MTMFERRVVIPDHVLVRELQSEAVILNLNDENYVGLDEVATQMWNTLSASSRVGEAFDRLIEHYDVEPERLRTDLEAFIDGLLARQLIELRDE